MKYLPLLLVLAGCAAETGPEQRNLSAMTQPLCTILCFVTVHNAEAGKYPQLRRVGDIGSLSSSNTQSSTTSSGIGATAVQ